MKNYEIFNIMTTMNNQDLKGLVSFWVNALGQMKADLSVASGNLSAQAAPNTKVKIDGLLSDVNKHFSSLSDELAILGDVS